MTGISTNKKEVSVIIPLLNEESFVERCITILQERIQEKTTEVILSMAAVQIKAFRF